MFLALVTAEESFKMELKSALNMYVYLNFVGFERCFS